ncbi:MAG: 16S rRNA (cytosine(967)-C(5))-methyltransferase RsmB [Lachnospiraceae bacterium]|nr:16S rRNA (cytosine(967)-C(5))-methyltransferase RsmB [Robinsoniella sp.]MDY3767211.1 16S rRNA (cytosine(967)-C(5))-methyltransferase RsmB [Lachnospiraceae bacterium]
MIKTINIREIILEILMQITEEEEYSHIVIRNVLEKYQFLEKRDRAFISRVCAGTVENMIMIDYMIEQFSKVKVVNMKPIIRNLLRMSVYQLRFMDTIPDSAVCNEAVKIAQKRGFYNLKGFVNGVLRNMARGMDTIIYPTPEKDPISYLSVIYSMPEWIVRKWVAQFGFDQVEAICQSFQKERMTSIRCNLDKASKKEVIDSLEEQGITVRENPYLNYALEIGNYNYMKAINAFKKGYFQVQDVSSMLVAEVAAPKWGDYCIDVCAAPGGKSLHLADKLCGSGFVEARDVTESKVRLMEENIDRIDVINMKAVVADATVFDPESVEKADILLADLPCSGLGVIGKKPDIKYKMTPIKQQELVKLQRKILDTVYRYVKVGGTLIYSTCTIGADENQFNVKWFLENYPFRLESIDPYLCDELKGKTTKAGYLQLLPGIHQSDGFFLAKFKRIQ